MIICLEQGADLRMAQLMPLLLTVSCFSKLQMGFTFLVPAHPGSPGQRAVKRLCVCVCVILSVRSSYNNILTHGLLIVNQVVYVLSALIMFLQHTSFAVC